MTIAQSKGRTLQHVSCPAANASTSGLHIICLMRKLSRGADRRKCQLLESSPAKIDIEHSEPSEDRLCFRNETELLEQHQ